MRNTPAGLWAVLCVQASTAFGQQSAAAAHEQKLIGAGATSSDRFGAVVAIDGDTAVIGAPYADPNEQGAAYVFVRNAGAWTQQAKLVAGPGAADADHFGAAVAIDGNTVVVGAPDSGQFDSGRVYVFERSGVNWSAAQLLQTSLLLDRLGTAVAIRNDHIAASAPLSGVFREGAVVIYTRSSAGWMLRTQFPSDYQDDDNQMGLQIALAETSSGFYTLLATSVLDGAEMYQGSGATWSYIRSVYLSPFTSYVDSVAASDTHIAAGNSQLFHSGLPEPGVVGVYALNGSTLTLESTLTASDFVAYDHFGASLAFSGGRLLAGAPDRGDIFGPDIGAAYLFERGPSGWTEQAIIESPDGGPSDRFGRAIAFDGSNAIVGAPFDHNSGALFVGAAYALRIGSPSVSFCASGVSSLGCQARLAATGSPSASFATPFDLVVSRVEAQRAGLIFYGASAATSAPWGQTGALCVKGPTQRTSAQLSGGNFGACDGALSLDWNAFHQLHPGALGQPFSAGQEFAAQAWYRDPPSAKTTQLSDALAFVLLP